MIAAVTACSTPEKKTGETAAGFIDEATILSSVEGVKLPSPALIPSCSKRGETRCFAVERGGRCR